MGKAWNSGYKKPMHERQPIMRVHNVETGMTEYSITREDGTGQQVSRAWAEHEVCSGNARYVHVEA